MKNDLICLITLRGCSVLLLPSAEATHSSGVFFFQAEDGIRVHCVTGVQTCALPIFDPRKVGLANKADVWLRVRPGSDGALALGLANIMIERRWYDEAFVRLWSNGPLLVRSDTDRLLRTEDLVSGGSGQCVAWDL